MSDLPEQDFISEIGTGVPSSESLPNVPPPPPEVKVRTLKSDIESMARSGGATPQFQNVKVPGLASARQEQAATAGKTGFSWSVAVVALIAVGLVVAIGYFAYQIFFKVSPDAPQNKVSTAPPPLPTSPPPPPPPAIGTSGGFVHRSLFRNQPDKFLTMTVGGSAQNGGGLKTYTQQLRELVSGEKTPIFLEINVKGVDGHDFTVNEIFSVAGAATVLDSQFVTQHFNPDSTVFVYRDKNGGSWPGYVLALKPSENWLFLRDSFVSQVEKSQKVQSFFVNSPRVSGTEKFNDVVVSGQPARSVKFSSGESFVYGWFRGYLILSTSEDGLKAALAYL